MRAPDVCSKPGKCATLAHVTVYDLPWETRHALWRKQGNYCGECARNERGLDHPPAVPGWRRVLALARSIRGNWLQPPVLLGSALDPDGSLGLRDSSPPPPAGPSDNDRVVTAQARETAPPPSTAARALSPYTLPELRRMADNLEAKIQGLKNRGPVQSRPAWERAIAEAEDELTRVWTAWRDRLDEDAAVQPE